MGAFYRGGLAVSRVAAACALLLILATALLTCVDIVIRNVGFRGLIGMVDITQLLVLAAASFVIPFAFYSQAHVAVDIVTQRLSARTNAAIALFSTLSAAGFLALITAYGWSQAQMSIRAGDVSQTLQWPIAIYWGLFLAGNALSVYAALAMALRHLLHVAGGRDPFPTEHGQGLQ